MLEGRWIGLFVLIVGLTVVWLGWMLIRAVGSMFWGP